MKKLSRKQLIVLGLLLALVVIGGIFLASYAIKANREYQASLPTPTPTVEPTATREPATHLVVKGGQVFLNNPAVKQYLLETYNIEVESQAMGSFEMIDNLEGIDAVWVGSGISADFFMANHPDLHVKSDRVFTTNTVIFTWRVPDGPDYVAALEGIGWVTEENGQYLFKMEPFLEAMEQGKTWADVGAPEIPGLVNIRFTAPEKSGGGQAWMYLLADYLASRGETGVRTFRASDLDAITPILNAIWDSQPRQITASPELFEEFVLSGYNGMPLVASSESLYLGWRNGLPDDRRADADQIVGLYPDGGTATTDHILIGLTDAGKNLVSIFGTDATLQEMSWSLMGMRTSAGGVSARPGDTDVAWIARSAVTIGDPKYTDAYPLLVIWGVAK